MGKILLKFYDEDVDFEAFLITDDENADKIVGFLDDFREDNSDYNWDGFVAFLKENGVEFETIKEESIYF